MALNPNGWITYHFLSIQQNHCIVTPGVYSHLTCVLFLECCYRRLASRAPLSRLSLSVDCWRSWPTRPRWSDLQHIETTVKTHTHTKTKPCTEQWSCVGVAVGSDEMQDVPDCGMAFATLAAAERLLVLGEPVGALLVVSCEQRQFISHVWTLEGRFLYVISQNLKKGSTHHWSPCCHSGLFGEQRLQIRAQYAHSLQLVFN